MTVLVEHAEGHVVYRNLTRTIREETCETWRTDPA